MGAEHRPLSRVHYPRPIGTVTQLYLQDGQSLGDAGDLMVLTLANVLGMPITVFTSVQNMPVLCIMPTSQSVAIEQPLFLAFTQHGAGHYDAVIPISASQMLQPTTDIVKCNCGRKTNFEGNACSSKRCKCYRMKTNCKDVCRCKFCGNSYGNRPFVCGKRKRSSYVEQEHQPLRGSVTEDFMKSKSEVINKGHLSLLETLLLKGIVIYLIVHGLSITPNNVLNMFQIMQHICKQCNHINFPLFERSESCIIYII